MSVKKSLYPNGPLPVDRLQVIWKALAGKYFSSRLPPIKIEWSSRLTASSGLFVSHLGPRSEQLRGADQRGLARLIRLSAPLLRDQPESEIVRTLAHEMIHQWQYDIKKCRPTHGPEFLKFMERMNDDGMGISIRHSLNEQVEAFTKFVWQCTTCGESYRRQRRSISPNRHRCGSCYGSLREVSLDFPDQATFLTKPSMLGSGPKTSHQTPLNSPVPPQQLNFDFV